MLIKRFYSGFSIRQVLFICILMAASSVSYADDLLSIVELAKQHDPSYLASRHVLDAKSELQTQAKSHLLPSLSYQYEKRKTHQEIVKAENSVFAQGDSRFDSHSQGLVLNQTLFNWEAWSRYQQSKASVKGAKAEALLAEQEMLLRAAENYFLVLEKTDQLATVADEKAALQTHYEMAKQKKLAGLGRSVDVEAAEARFLESVSKQIEMQSRLEDSRYGLMELTGRLPTDLERLSKDVQYSLPTPAEPSYWVALGRENNPSIIAAEHALEAAKKEIDSRKSGHYPNVDLSYSNGREDTGGSLFGGGSELKTDEWVLTVKVPIFQGNNVSSRVKQAIAERYRAMEELNKLQRENERDIRDALLRIKGSLVQIEALERSVSAQQRMLELKSNGYKSGLYNILEVLDAQKDLSAVQQMVTKSRYDYVLNSLRLKFASGGLATEDIASINLWLGDD